MRSESVVRWQGGKGEREREREKEKNPTSFTIMPLSNLQLWERVVGAIIQYSKQYFYGQQKKCVQSNKNKKMSWFLDFNTFIETAHPILQWRGKNDKSKFCLWKYWNVTLVKDFSASWRKIIKSVQTTLTLRETITSEQTLTLQLPSESLFLDSIQHHPPQIYMLLCAERTTLLNIIKITNTFFFLFKIWMLQVVRSTWN